MELLARHNSLTKNHNPRAVSIHYVERGSAWLGCTVSTCADAKQACDLISRLLEHLLSRKDLSSAFVAKTGLHDEHLDHCEGRPSACQFLKCVGENLRRRYKDALLEKDFWTSFFSRPSCVSLRPRWTSVAGVRQFWCAYVFH